MIPRRMAMVAALGVAVLGLMRPNALYAQVSATALSPHIAALGRSARFVPAVSAGGLTADQITTAVQDVLVSKFPSDVSRVGADLTTSFRLGKGRLGTAGLLRLRRMSRAQAIGLYAERRLELTTGWRRVSKPNAPQNDLYRSENGRLIGAQVKTHAAGDPASYVRDMRADTKAEVFLVPDDHYEGIAGRLRQQADRARAQGDLATAEWHEEQLSRLRKMGVKYSELEAEADLVVKLAETRLAARVSSYVVTGALVAISAYRHYEQYYVGHITGRELAFRMGQDAVSLGAGIGGAAVGTWIFKGSSLGPPGVAAAAVFLAQETFLILDYGSFEAAFREPAFWITSAGDFSDPRLRVFRSRIPGARVLDHKRRKCRSCRAGNRWRVVRGKGGSRHREWHWGTHRRWHWTRGGRSSRRRRRCNPWSRRRSALNDDCARDVRAGFRLTTIALEMCAPDFVYAVHDRRIDDRIQELTVQLAAYEAPRSTVP